MLCFTLCDLSGLCRYHGYPRCLSDATIVLPGTPQIYLCVISILVLTASAVFTTSESSGVHCRTSAATSSPSYHTDKQTSVGVSLCRHLCVGIHHSIHNTNNLLSTVRELVFTLSIHKQPKRAEYSEARRWFRAPDLQPIGQTINSAGMSARVIPSSPFYTKPTTPAGNTRIYEEYTPRLDYTG